MLTHNALTALIYTDSTAADQALRRAVGRLEALGLRLAGVVQRDDVRPGRASCDMSLEDLMSGETIAISQDRGPHARGCRLDVGELLRATALVAAALAQQPHVLVLNKFGKTEAEGGGFRDLIAQAIDASIPVLIAVPYRNLDQWRAFAGDLGRELALDGLDEEALMASLAAARLMPRGEPHAQPTDPLAANHAA
jgi:nucleoside-triphosphatase THEP1